MSINNLLTYGQPNCTGNWYTGYYYSLLTTYKYKREHSTTDKVKKIQYISLDIFKYNALIGKIQS